MNKELLEKDLRETLQKHGLNIQYLSIDHEKISNNFFTTNNNIFNSSEYWFEEIEVNRINWLLSDYGTKDIQLDFVIGDYELVYNAVHAVLNEYTSSPDSNLTDELIESNFGDFEETKLEDLKAFLSERIFNEILENIIYRISEEYMSNIEEHLGAWFGIDYPDETFNDIEALAYWTIYFKPCIWDEDVAWEVGLIPFSFEGENYLALGGCGMDLSPKLDAYQALTDGTIPSSSRFRDDHDYAKYVVGEKIFNKVKEIVKCDPLIHIQTEVSDE